MCFVFLSGLFSAAVSILSHFRPAFSRDVQRDFQLGLVGHSRESSSSPLGISWGTVRLDTATSPDVPRAQVPHRWSKNCTEGQGRLQLLSPEGDVLRQSRDLKENLIRNDPKGFNWSPTHHVCRARSDCPSQDLLDKTNCFFLPENTPGQHLLCQHLSSSCHCFCPAMGTQSSCRLPFPPWAPAAPSLPSWQSWLYQNWPAANSGCLGRVESPKTAHFTSST